MKKKTTNNKVYYVVREMWDGNKPTIGGKLLHRIDEKVSPLPQMCCLGHFVLQKNDNKIEEMVGTYMPSDCGMLNAIGICENQQVQLATTNDHTFPTNEAKEEEIVRVAKLSHKEVRFVDTVNHLPNELRPKYAKLRKFMNKLRKKEKQ